MEVSSSEKFTMGGHSVFVIGNIEFVKVPRGKFLMGPKFVKINNVCPQHEVNIPYDFLIGRFPVTNKEYAAFKLASNSSFDYSKEIELHPVTDVSWLEVQKYIHWLNGTYQKELPHGYMFRLQSEAEWYKASFGTDGSDYPWGDGFDQSICVERDYGLKPVGTYSPAGDSPYGVSDVMNNIREWTRSLYEPYPYDLYDGREVDEISGTDYLVLCKGYTMSMERRASGEASSKAALHYEAPYTWTSPYGFRLVISPKP